MSNHGTTVAASSSGDSFDTYFENLIALIAEAIPEELYDTDGSREIGVIAIAAWHHGIAKLAAKHQVQVPPVLLSTLGMLVVLCILKGVLGKGSSRKVVNFFDPSVGFLGDWMALWLVPSLVLFPNALKTVEQPAEGGSGSGSGSAVTMWVKLIIVHFILWCLSTTGTAKLFELVEKALPPPRNVSTGSSSSSSSATTPSRAPPTPAAVRAAKQLRLLRFWGVVTAGCYAAPATGVWQATPGSLAPALAGTTITSLIAGNMMSPGVKKVLHPLLFCALVSGVAAIVSDRYYAGMGMPGPAGAAGAAVGEYCVREGEAWQDSLHMYTSPGGPPKAGADSQPALRAGDYFNLLLGPSVVALAFRIFSSAEDERVAARVSGGGVGCGC